MDADGPLDFEMEDPLLSPSTPTNKKRRKIIGLDDLLTDYYKEKSKLTERNCKQSLATKCYNSDEEDDTSRKNKEKLLSKFVNDCQKQVHELSTEDDIPLWGLQLFGCQKPPPSFNLTGLQQCKLFRSLKNDELNSVLELNMEKGGAFLEGLLTNRWLSKLVCACGYVEESIASWSFYQMLYSSNKEVQESACDFYCSILSSKTEANLPLVRFEWFPTYVDLNGALAIYGYPSDSATISSVSEHMDAGTDGPPLNLKCWIKFVTACCRVRNVQSIFSTSEVEELLRVIIYLCLDRKLHGLSFLLDECMQSLVNFFLDDEWRMSCLNVAKWIAHRVPKDLNCLRVVECIYGSNTRNKHLRSELGLQILRQCFGADAVNAKDILEFLIAINVKEKNCDLFKLYIYMVLAEYWLLSGLPLDEKSTSLNMWSKHLKNCSSQITSTDWRSYASKVRNRASYLLQNLHPKKEV